jgi:hypothetical protein
MALNEDANSDEIYSEENLKSSLRSQKSGLCPFLPVSLRIYALNI